MKKRALAVILALCISSGNMMSAFAMASENGASAQVATEEESPAEETNSGENEIEEPGNAEVPADLNEDSSSGDDGNSGSVNEEEAVIPADGEGNDAAIPTVIEDDGADGSGDSSQGVSAGDGGDLSEGDGNSMQPDPAVDNDAQGDETSQEGSSISDVQMEPAGDNTLTEEQGGETAAEVAVEKITLDKTSATMSVGEQLQLNAVIQPADATNKKVNWSSSKESIVTVNENGLITAVSGGCANIRVVTEDGQKAFCVVTVVANEGSCGENLTWSLSGTDSNMVLTISGSGEMTDYDSVLDAPWYGNSQNIKEIQLSPDVTYIGKYAFANCKALESITVPDGVESIGDSAFSNCSALKDVYLPDGISTIGSYAFSDCRSLRTIDLPETLTDLGERAFSNAGLYSITLPKGITEIKEGTFNQCSRLSSVNLSSETKEIGGDAFFNCSSLRFLELPEGITTIKGGAFYGTGIDELTIPTTITELSSGIFGYSGGGNRVKLFFYGTEEEWKRKQLEYNANNVTFMIEEPQNTEDPAVDNDAQGDETSQEGSSASDAQTEPASDNTLPEEQGGETAADVLKGITLDKAEVEIGIEEQLQLTVNFDPAEAANKNVTWTSSNEEVATVDENGRVTAHSLGTTDITVTTENGEYSAICKVSVVIVPVDNILLDKNNSELWIGRTLSLSAIVLPENAANKNVTWASSNENVVTVDESGVVTAVGKGNATVTATSEDGQKSAACNVTVKDDILESGSCGDDVIWTVSGSGDDLKLTISGTGPMYDYSWSEWEDSDGGIYVESAAPWKEYIDRITSIVIEDGVTRIGNYALAFSGKKNSIEIPASVTEIGTYALMDCIGPINYWGTNDKWKSLSEGSTLNALSIGFNMNELVLGNGQVQYLGITCNHGECDKRDIIWSSSDDEIVSVDSWGRATAKQLGEAVITASLYGVECELPVKVVLSASEIALDQKELSLNKGETGNLAATIKPEDAAFKDIIWESSDPDVVAVDSDGKLTALHGGTAVVSASSSHWDLKDSCIVTVIAPVSGITLEEEAVVDLNAERLLNASVSPEDATNKNVIWTSSDEEVAQIDNEGRVQGVGIGTAEITAATEDGAYTAVCLVRVITPVTAVELNQENMTLEIGQSAAVAATVLPEDAVDKSIVWESSDSEVASVDENGMITAQRSGKATITATSLNGTTAKCEVTVPMPLNKITYVMNGGKNNQANPADYRDGSVVQLKNPTRGGYIFGGWYLDAKFTKKATGIAAGQTGDKTFYARWTGKTYKIVFNGNTANKGKMSKITYTMGKSTALPANAFVKKEYIFTGWNTKANGKGVAFKNKGSLGAFDAPNGGTITLYAQWKIRQYTITYKLNGGVNNKANPVAYNFKSANISLAKPTRRGYSFQGWYTDAACKKAFKGIKKGSTGNRTVYAKWKIVKYTIQYVLNKGTAPKGNPAAYYVTSATIKLKNPTRKGYTFLGWYKEATFKTKVVAIPKGSIGNMKLYAKWKLTDYPIVYQLNGGKNHKSNPATYKMTSKTFGLSNPARKGYKFAGWYTDAKFTKKFTNIPKGSIGKKTVYAKWTMLTYTITYNLNGGKNAAGNPIRYAVASNTITLLDPKERAGYTFEGWYTDAGFKNQITQIPKGSAGNYTLYAKWNAITYNISYVVEGGVNNEENPASYNVTSEFSFKEPLMNDPRNGYVFRGWYSDIECTRKVTGIKKGSTGDITLYAKWCFEGFSNFPDRLLAGQQVDSVETGIDNDSLSFRSSNTDLMRVYHSGSSISLEAKNPGIARIELVEDGQVIDSINIDVLDYSNAKVVVNTNAYDVATDKRYDTQITFPGTKTCFVSDRMDFDSVTIYKEGMSIEIWNTYNMFSVRNLDPSVAEISYELVTLKKAGTCKISITGEYNLSEELTVTVKDRVKTPCIVEQRNVKVGSQNVAVYSDSIRLDIKDLEMGDYEFYRSTSPNSGYKKIEGPYDDNLKPNTKYYYKARVKLRGQNVFGPFSKPVAYWTAPKGSYDYLDSTNKIKYNESSHKISWPKINGATGYYVIPFYSWFRGYNIFGQRVYASTIELKRTTNTSIAAWKCSGHWPTTVRAVVPYAIHNGYIYMDGYRLTNSFERMTSELRQDYQ